MTVQPIAVPGLLPDGLEQAWRARAVERRGGHLAWTGARDHHGVPVLKHRGARYTATRLAYLIEHGTVPVGHAKAGCGWPGCVAPAHLIDTADWRAVHAPYVRYESAEAKLAALTEPTDDGHLLWVGPTTSDGRRLVSFGGVDYRAARIAFRGRWGREPVGPARPACDRPGCLLGDHLDDSPARAANRALFSAVFGD